ncbi:MAG: diacylglycerol kinase [Rubrivivax sp.]|nr:diacylglycerol kinase [Rubrivivax sp.]
MKPSPGDSAFKSRGGLGRVWRALGYSMAGLRAALRHEAAFRQELALGLPLMGLAPWVAPGRWAALAMIASILLVLVVELLNSAVEALADAVSPEPHPMLGRAKDLGSAAVMLSLLLAAATWAVALWP